MHKVVRYSVLLPLCCCFSLLYPHSFIHPFLLIPPSSWPPPPVSSSLLFSSLLPRSLACQGLYSHLHSLISRQDWKEKEVPSLSTIVKMFLKVKAKAAQLCLTFFDPMEYTIHGILQARILEWVAFPFSRGSSQCRDWTQDSHIAGRFFTSWATKKP